MKQCMYKVDKEGVHSINYLGESVKYSAKLVENEADMKAAEADGFHPSLVHVLEMGEEVKPVKLTEKKKKSKDL